MSWMDWYNALAKPSWTPAPSTISLIWTILYPVILVSFGFVFVQAFRGRVGWKVALPFAINLVANLLFMPIFAGLRNVPLACGHRDRVGDDHLVRGRRLAALSVGGRGPGAVLRVGVHRHGDPGVDHLDESVSLTCQRRLNDTTGFNSLVPTRSAAGR